MLERRKEIKEDTLGYARPAIVIALLKHQHDRVMSTTRHSSSTTDKAEHNMHNTHHGGGRGNRQGRDGGTEENGSGR